MNGSSEAINSINTRGVCNTGEEKPGLQVTGCLTPNDTVTDHQALCHDDRHLILHEKQANGENVAKMLALSCRSARQAETKRASIPQRNGSTPKPSKRKRHDDFVTLHRNSCQLFSSLDGTLAQMRASTSSSSSSSTVSCPSPSSSPTVALYNQHTSQPSTVSGLAFCSKSVPDAIEPLDSRLVNRRPALRRSCVKPPQQARAVQNSVHAPQQLPNTSHSEQKSESSFKGHGTISNQVILLARPPTITAHSCYSSQTSLPPASVPTTNSASLNPTSTTTIHWTSPETRQREYAKIDAANSGLRLFFRRVFPRSMCRRLGGGRATFWDETAAGERDDATSVRRFRLIAEGDEKNSGKVHEVALEDDGKHSETDVKAASVGIVETEIQRESRRSRNWNETPEVSKRTHTRTTTELSSASRSSETPLLPRSAAARTGWKKTLSCCS